MKKRRLLLYALVASIFVINLVGASWIVLTGSDEAPFEQTFPGQCSHPTVSVVYDDPTKPNPKVTEVILTGDFSRCVGSQVLVTTYKTGHIHSYAVAEVLQSQEPIELSFVKHGGDFYQKFPLVINHRLVSDGPTSPSSVSIDPADIEVIFAWEWN